MVQSISQLLPHQRCCGEFGMSTGTVCKQGDWWKTGSQDLTRNGCVWRVKKRFVALLLDGFDLNTRAKGSQVVFSESSEEPCFGWCRDGKIPRICVVRLFSCLVPVRLVGGGPTLLFHGYILPGRVPTTSCSTSVLRS